MKKLVTERARGTQASPDVERRTWLDLSPTSALRTSMTRNTFSVEDNKSKNILAWAGRVKQLIGTYDQSGGGGGRETASGRLTRATGYDDLLSACGVASGDKRTTIGRAETDWATSMKLMTNYETKMDPSKSAAATPLVEQLVAEKEDACRMPLAASDRLQTSKSFSSTASRSEERAPTQREKHELRRSASSQGGGNADVEASPRPALLPPSKRSSQSSVKPSDAFRGADARPSLRKSLAGENATAAATSATAGQKASSTKGGDSGQSQATRARLARRTSDESVIQSDFCIFEFRSHFQDRSYGCGSRRQFAHAFLKVKGEQ